MRNTKSILEHFHIDFVSKHPSVGKGAVGICCPFCGEDNYHVGVFLTHGNFSCWKCGEKGTLYKLIRKIKDISYKEFCEYSGIITQEGSPKLTLDKIFKKGVPMEKIIKNEISFEGLVSIPDTCFFECTVSSIDKFLIERSFSYSTLNAYNAFYGISGYFSQRLVIPVPKEEQVGNVQWADENIIGLIGRDLTDTSKSKYLFNPGFQVHNNLFYTHNLNFDSDTWFVLVEGIFDAWAIERLGHNFVGVAMFGSNLSNEQLDKLSLNTRKVLYIPDGDTKVRTIKKTMESLCYPFFDRVLYVKLPSEHDPCSIDSGTLKQLIQEKIL